jgi:hypothetical protein
MNGLYKARQLAALVSIATSLAATGCTVEPTLKTVGLHHDKSIEMDASLRAINVVKPGPAISPWAN